MYMLQLISQIDVWQHDGATSPAPQMDTAIGWNWCVCVCGMRKQFQQAGSTCDCGHVRDSNDSNACVKIMLCSEIYQLKYHWLKPILAASYG